LASAHPKDRQALRAELIAEFEAKKTAEIMGGMDARVAAEQARIMAEAEEIAQEEDYVRGGPPPKPDADEFQASDLKGLPPVRQWFVEGTIPQGNVTILSGDGGCGKSLLALQLAVACLTGSKWLGAVPKAGPVIYLSAEDDKAELHRRLDAMSPWYGFDYQGDEGYDMTIISKAGKNALIAAPLTNNDISLTHTELYYQLKFQIIYNQASLVIIDNLADVYGGNEINRVHARQFIGFLRSLCIEHHTTILLLMHPSKAGSAKDGDGSSGSTAWHNSVRSRLYMKRDPEDLDRREIKTMKANYGQAGGVSHLRYDKGMFIPDEVTE
jgi:RecA-family ATPase